MIFIIFKCTIQCSKDIHNVVQPSPPFIPRIFSSSQTETVCPVSSNFHFRFLSAPAPITVLPALFQEYDCSSYKRIIQYLILCLPLSHLAYFQDSSMLQQVSEFLSRLKNIPLYINASLLICSSVGLFPLLALVNNAAMNMSVPVSA